MLLIDEHYINREEVGSNKWALLEVTEPRLVCDFNRAAGTDAIDIAGKLALM